MRAKEALDMQRALVVADSSKAGRKLLKNAGDIAAETNSELVILNAIDSEEYTNQLQTTQGKGDLDSLEEIIENAKQEAAEFADSVLDKVSVSYKTIGIVENLPEGILDQAKKQDCDHIFISSNRKSPTGKALFGDNAQFIILNFEGPVTVMTPSE